MRIWRLGMSAALALLLGGAFVAGESPLRDDPPEFAASLDVAAEEQDPSTAEVPSRGPAANSSSPRTSQLTCTFVLEAMDSNYYSMGAESRWKNPQNSIIEYSQVSHNGPALVGQIQTYSQLGNYGSYECSVDFSVIPWGYIGSGQGSINVNGKCSTDSKSTVMEEYYSPNLFAVSYRPSCNDFVQNAEGGGTFNWSDWMTSQSGEHDGWGLSQNGMLSQTLPSTQDYYVNELNGVDLILTSGYRCPHVNAAVGGASNSRHMYGDAADLIPNSGQLSGKGRQWGYDEWWLLTLSGLEAGASYYEPWGTGAGQTTSHVHIDNR